MFYNQNNQLNNYKKLCLEHIPGLSILQRGAKKDIITETFLPQDAKAWDQESGMAEGNGRVVGEMNNALHGVTSSTCC
jgi:hypothetical protein